MSTPLRERPDAPLGTLIFRAGLLPAETIENALEEGVKTGRRLGEILIERGLLQEEDLTRLLAGQKGLPFVSLGEEQIDPEAVKLLSQDQARLFSALPIRIEEGVPLVAVADPTNDVLNRNIREALGQDVRLVVAGRSDLEEVIGRAYSGSLPAFAPAEPAPANGAPLRVDTSVQPPAEEAPAATYEPEPQVAPEPELHVQAETEPEFAPEPHAEVAPEPEPEIASEPQPEIAPEPEPVFEAPAQEEAPVHEPEPAQAFEPAPAPTFEPAPEPVATPELEPVAAFAEPEAPQTYEPPPLPTYEEPAPPVAEPVVPLATEPVAPQTLQETNGEVPHDVDDNVLPPEPAAPQPEQIAPSPVPAPTTAEPPAASTGAGFTVFVRLTSGERLTVAECADVGEAKGYAKALTKQLGGTDPDDWPFVNGRFLKPDTIVSVDVEAS
jgi:hypothetical protein